MPNWKILKEAISEVITSNGNQEITGQLLQNVLNSIVSSVGENATFAGAATPTTNPGVPDGPVVYMAFTEGIYPNFSGIALAAGEIVLLKNTSTGSWLKILVMDLSAIEKDLSAIEKDLSAIEKDLPVIEKSIKDIKDGSTPVEAARRVLTGLVYNGYVTPNTILPIVDNAFYLTATAGNYIDRESNAVSVNTEGVSLIQRKNGEWKVYALWELVSELNNASSTRFASAKAVKILKDMIDQLAAFGGAEGTIPIDSKLSLESIYPVQNAVITSAIYRLERAVFHLEVTLTVSPSAAQEYTGANKEFTISWTIKIAGESVVPSKLTLTVGGTIVTTDESKTSITVEADNDRTINLSVEADGRAATKTANINFARRYYSAVVSSSWTATNDTVSELIDSALTKSALKNAKAATVTYSEAKQRKIVFAYPKSHGVMDTIRDARENDMFTLNDSGKTFNTVPTIVAVTLSGGATLDYYVYESVITNIVAGNITYTTKTFD